MKARLVCGGVGLVLALTGCKTAGFSALQSVNPVLLGPVTSLGGGSAYGQPARAFVSKSSDTSDLIIGVSRENNTTTTTVNGSSATSSSDQADFDVLVATDGNPSQRVTTNHIGCGGYDFNVFFLYYISSSWCEAQGSVYAGAAPASAAPPPPPAAPAGATAPQASRAP